MKLHPGDIVRVVGSKKALREINLHTHSCMECLVEETRDNWSEPDIKLRCGYVVPRSMIRLRRCPHTERVPAVHAYTKARIACGIAIMPGTKFAMSENRWTCKACLRAVKRGL